MQTTQCPRCRHTFLSYAAECPECGLKRPRNMHSKWWPRAAVLLSVFALAATTWMVKYVAQQDDVPAPNSRATVQAASQKAAPKGAQVALQAR